MLEQQPQKPSLLDELLDLLRKALEYCLCCITCGCYPGPNRDFHGDVYDAELMEQEREAVQNLLKYMDSDSAKKPTINEERLRALCILTYSDNDELQRSAALCFAEISERMTTPVSEETLEPLVVLLKSRDPQIQKASSLAISNFALSGGETNKAAIMASGAIKPLIQLLSSPNLEVQCNTCGCITTLATTDANKQEIVAAKGLRPLLKLAQSTDARVQRNATGALLNLTHLQSNRNELVQKGALPVLVEVLHSKDCDVQYYCAAALSNMAVNEKHRAMMVAIGHYDVVKQLIRLLSSSKEKVKCQSCLALRNLASDGDNQILMVKLGGLPAIHTVLKHSSGETRAAAVACLRNLSIHRSNEVHIISETFLSELRRIVKDSKNSEAQIHAAGTIRNLAAGDQIRAMTQSGCVEALTDSLLDPETQDAVLGEITAALAVLADEDDSKQKLLGLQDGALFEKLVDLASESPSSEVRYNCAGAIGQLCVIDIPPTLLDQCTSGLLNYLETFLQLRDPSFVHIALWTLVQLLKVESFRAAAQERGLDETIEEILRSGHTEAIKELAQTVIQELSIS